MDYDVLQGSLTASAVHINTLPALPSDQTLDTLVKKSLFLHASTILYRGLGRNTAAASTARDHLLCLRSSTSRDADRSGFFWIIYAIGAGLISNPEHPPKASFACARNYLHVVLARQDLTSF